MNNAKRIIKAGIIICIIGFIFACALAKIGYDYCFRRLDDAADEWDYPRTAVYFMSADNKLSGYIYGEDNSKGLLIFALDEDNQPTGILDEDLFGSINQLFEQAIR